MAKIELVLMIKFSALEWQNVRHCSYYIDLVTLGNQWGDSKWQMQGKKIGLYTLIDHIIVTHPCPICTTKIRLPLEENSIWDQVHTHLELITLIHGKVLPKSAVLFCVWAK